MTVLRNGGRWGPSNAVYARGRVLAYDKRSPPPGAEWIDYGLLALTPAALEGDEPDLADVPHRLAAAGQLAGMPVRAPLLRDRHPEALAETDRFLRRAGDIGQ